jgi:hypothetical protein
MNGAIATLLTTVHVLVRFAPNISIGAPSGRALQYYKFRRGGKPP